MNDLEHVSCKAALGVKSKFPLFLLELQSRSSGHIQLNRLIKENTDDNNPQEGKLWLLCFVASWLWKPVPANIQPEAHWFTVWFIPHTIVLNICFLYITLYPCLVYWYWDSSNFILMQVNSSPVSTAYTRQWFGPTMVHIMAFRLIGTKLLSKTMLQIRFILENAPKITVRKMATISLIVLYFLHSTSVLSFYIDVVLTLFIVQGRWVK